LSRGVYVLRHDRVLWALAIILSIALLMAPALWNGFALLQWDTGGYLARWYEGYLVPSRAVVYGLLLNAGAPLAFWPVVALQSALTVWLIVLTLRAHGLARRPLLLLGVMVALSLFTTLPWLTSILLTDIFAGLSVLALYLLLLRNATLGRGERVGLVALIAVSAATHNATLAVLLGLVIAAALSRLINRERIPLAHIGRGLLALALGVVLVLAADVVVAKRLAWTPGGFALSFGRMLQDGIVKKYLDHHCPDPDLRLCAYKDALPTDADTWFWGSSVFDRLGRFAGLDREMTKIVIDSVTEYPALQIETAAAATAAQLIDVHTGEGVLNVIWHTYRIIERYTPKLVPVMHAARQQNGGISFTAINTLQYPLALLAMALLPVLMFAYRALPAIGELAATVSLALLGNAFICGALANPHDRYGARMVWLAGLTVILAIFRGLADRLIPALGHPTDLA
jgi:lipoprotein signal peptidase